MSTPTLEDLPAPPEGAKGWPWTQSSPSPSSDRRADGLTISVVTPSYNQGPFIEETIRSVLLQGYPNLEYIVIDGGSTDETLDILQKYDPWIDHWVREPDEGQSHAIQKGLEQCSGEIFNWINSDDLLEPGALRTIARSFGNHDVLIGVGRHFTESESWQKKTSDFTARSLLRGAAGTSFSQQAVWLKTDQVKACGGVDPAFHYAMDRELYVRYTYHYPDVKYIDKPLSRFRLHAQSKSGVQDHWSTIDNPFRRDHLRMARKLRAMDAYSGLHDLCEQRIEWLEWQLYLARLREQENRSSFLRVIELIRRSFRHPGARVNRYTLGAARRILSGR
jgi:glycosyltransferase involved in cell wall biosynthesis